MTKKYQQLNREERDMIYLLLKQGKKKNEIAQALKRDKSTIGRELKRNKHRKFNEYLPDTAHRKALKKKQQSRKKKYLEKDQKLKQHILSRLQTGWSPELIAGRLKQNLDKTFNQESIYQYIYSLDGRKQNLRQYLRRAHRIRRKKFGRKNHKGKIPNRIDISLRPKIVETKQEFGHWEADSILYQGHSQRLSTHNELKTRFLVVLRPKDNTAEHRAEIINQAFERLPKQARKTKTVDNGLEFACHEKITAALGMRVYFAKPFCSWQRGANENINGLLRWFIPKNTNLDDLTDEQLQGIVDLINNRPRKCLGFKTPTEMFQIEMDKLNKFKGRIFNSSNYFFNRSVALAN